MTDKEKFTEMSKDLDFTRISRLDFHNYFFYNKSISEIESDMYNIYRFAKEVADWLKTQ